VVRNLNHVLWPKVACGDKVHYGSLPHAVFPLAYIFCINFDGFDISFVNLTNSIASIFTASCMYDAILWAYNKRRIQNCGWLILKRALA